MLNPLGGSELAYNELQTRMSDYHKENINIILSTCRYEFIDPKKINIVWQQLSYDQANVSAMKDTNFIDKIDLFVFVSHWQYEKFKQIYNVPSNKSIVIQNATNEFPIHTKPRDKKLKLIYTSMPDRGLELLVDLADIVRRDDYEIDVYSSTIIYGTEYDRLNKGRTHGTFERARNLPNVYLKGYATNNDIRSALLNSHIMLYPCIFEETSCMSVIEALSAGCKLICNNLGALKETAGVYADMITYDTEKSLALKKFTKLLNQTLDEYWNTDVQEKLQDQVLHYKKYWSWDTRIIQWNRIFNRLMEIKYGK